MRLAQAVMASRSGWSMAGSLATWPIRVVELVLDSGSVPAVGDGRADLALLADG